MICNDKSAAMDAAEKKAKILKALAVAGADEIGIALYNEYNELSALFAVKNDPDKTVEEMLTEANGVFPVFVSRYKSKIDIDSLGTAKAQFNMAILDWKVKLCQDNNKVNLPM